MLVGKLGLFRGHYRNRNLSRFNIGQFFGRHKGFNRLNTEESDELDPLHSDSDIEEYSATATEAALLGKRTQKA